MTQPRRSLDVLADKQAKHFVKNALEAIRSQLSSLRRECDEHPMQEDPTAYFAARNSLLITVARVDWLEEVLGGLNEITDE